MEFETSAWIQLHTVCRNSLSSRATVSQLLLRQFQWKQMIHCKAIQAVLKYMCLLRNTVILSLSYPDTWESGTDIYTLRYLKWITNKATLYSIQREFCSILYNDLHGKRIWKSISQFSCSVVSDSLQPHGLQHARLPCPSRTPRAYSNSCPLSL